MAKHLNWKKHHKSTQKPHGKQRNKDCMKTDTMATGLLIETTQKKQKSWRSTRKQKCNWLFGMRMFPMEASCSSARSDYDHSDNSFKPWDYSCNRILRVSRQTRGFSWCASRYKSQGRFWRYHFKPRGLKFSSGDNNTELGMWKASIYATPYHKRGHKRPEKDV